jgi:hypothetical protein
MTRLTKRRAVYVLPGIVLTLAILGSGWERFTTMRNDFLQFYVSTHLLGTPGLYDVEANRVLREALAPNAHIAYFPIRPAFHTMLVWPLRWLPLHWAFACFELFSVGCLILFVKMFSKRCPTLPVYASLSVPVAVCLMNGQDAILVLLVVGLAILLAEQERSFAAGLILSLCAIKFHLFFFLPVMLLVQKRWKILAGLVSGSLVLLLSTFAIQGWRWPLDLLSVLRKPELSPFVQMMPNLHGLWYGLGVDCLGLEVASFLVVGVLVIMASRNSHINQGISAVVIAGVLTSYHAYLYDPILLFVPLVLLPDRTLWAALTLPPLYYLAVMEGGVGTVGVGGLVVLMLAGLAAIAFPDAFRALVDAIMNTGFTSRLALPKSN